MPSITTVDEMIMNLPKAEQVITRRLRDLVLECLPGATERGYYGLGVPFYRHHRMICFIWPASVVWGPNKHSQVKKAATVSLGFCQGNLMSNEGGILQAEGRKQVYVMYFRSPKEIEENRIRALLFEASLIDGAFGERKKRATKK